MAGNEGWAGGWRGRGEIKSGTHSLQAEDRAFLAHELAVEEDSAPILLGKRMARTP